MSPSWYSYGGNSAFVAIVRVFPSRETASPEPLAEADADAEDEPLADEELLFDDEQPANTIVAATRAAVNAVNFFMCISSRKIKVELIIIQGITFFNCFMYI